MKLPTVIKEFASKFKQNNFQVYLVGGAVRDSLLNKENYDYDFTTDALPEDVIRMFNHVVPVGIKHGTVLVIFKGYEFEVTTFRTETTYSDNRRPDNVNFVSDLNEDLRRRDFTINAFAYDILDNKVTDNFDGKRDLRDKIIRAIGSPSERFQEDALRMLRACRFASKLSFKIDENTLDAIKENKDLIKNIAAERIRDELVKIMKSEKPSIAIEYMRVAGLLEHIIPELLEGFGIEQNKFHKYDVYYHNLYSCDAGPSDNYIVRFAALFHDMAKSRTIRSKGEDDENNTFYNHEIIGAKVAKKVMRRLKFPTQEINKISHLIRHHMFYYTEDWTDGAVRRFLRNVGIENLEDLFLLRDADREGNGKKTGIPKTYLAFKDKIKEIIAEDSALKVKDLDINGKILMNELQLTSGPLIGEILNYLLELVLDDPAVNEQDSLLKFAKEYYTKKRNYALEQYGDVPENLGSF